MQTSEIIDGLKDLIKDREALIESNAPQDNIFMHDKAVLQAAVDELSHFDAFEKPLTLEQIHGMDGEPVKVEENGEYQYGLISLNGHFLAPKEEVITMSSGNFYLIREMKGNFKVYPIYLSKSEGSEP